MKRINAIRSQRIVVRVRDGPTLRKLFTFGFLPSDGSIWIAVPYFEHSSEALLSELTMSAGQTGQQKLSLTEVGKVTTHRVKFSHHRSGECLFSLTGKVESVIRRQSEPLTAIAGHIATIQVEGLSGFKEDRSGRDDAPWDEPRRDRTITLKAEAAEAGSLKFVFNAYAKRFLRQHLGGREAGPWTNIQTTDGLVREGMIVAPPTGTPGAATFLVFTWERGKRLYEEAGHSGFSLIGGFDPPSISRDITKDSSFLAMLSPPENYKELLGSIGTIDLNTSRRASSQTSRRPSRSEP